MKTLKRGNKKMLRSETQTFPPPKYSWTLPKLSFSKSGFLVEAYCWGVDVGMVASFLKMPKMRQNLNVIHFGDFCVNRTTDMSTDCDEDCGYVQNVIKSKNWQFWWFLRQDMSTFSANSKLDNCLWILRHTHDASIFDSGYVQNVINFENWPVAKIKL